MKNLGEVINAVYRSVNAQRTRRWDVVDDIIPELNSAIREYVKAYYDDIKKTHAGVYFEAAQIVKAKLRKLVVRKYLLSINDSIATLPADYWYDVGLEVFLSGMKGQYSSSLSFNEEKPALLNSFYRPSTDNIQHMEYDGVLEIKYGGGEASIEKALLDYIKEPTAMYAIRFTSGTVVPGKLYWAEEGTINDGSYSVTDGVYAATSAIPVTVTGSAYEISDLQLGSDSWDEIVAITARKLMGISSDIERKQNSDFESSKS